MSSLTSPDSLGHYSKFTGRLAIPANALQVRESAHYKDINHKYNKLMTKAVLDKLKSVTDIIEKQSREEQLMKYAHPSYKYVPMKNIG